jgi:hypothetical protein
MQHQIREKELKNKITQDYFSAFDCTHSIGNVDFSVAQHHKRLVRHYVGTTEVVVQ